MPEEEAAEVRGMRERQTDRARNRERETEREQSTRLKGLLVYEVLRPTAASRKRQETALQEEAATSLRQRMPLSVEAATSLCQRMPLSVSVCRREAGSSLILLLLCRSREACADGQRHALTYRGMR